MLGGKKGKIFTHIMNCCCCHMIMKSEARTTDLTVSYFTLEYAERVSMHPISLYMMNKNQLGVKLYEAIVIKFRVK